MTIPACEPVKRHGGHALVDDRHAQQRHRDALARREEHVQLAAVRVLGDVVGEPHEVVGRLAHRRDDHDHLVSLAMGADDVLRDGPDPVGIRDRGAAVLLDNDWHATRLGAASWPTRSIWIRRRLAECPVRYWGEWSECGVRS